MATIKVSCLHCESTKVIKHGKTEQGKRYTKILSEIF